MELDDMKAVSLDEQARRVREAFWNREMYTEADGDSEPQEHETTYIIDVYEDSVIACKPDGTYWRVPYAMTADAVTFAPEDRWEAVEKEWIAAKGLDTLVFMGSTVKALGNGKVGGHLVLYGNPNEADFVGEYFTKSTEFLFNDGAQSPVYYQHGQDPVLKQRVIGKGQMTRDEFGVWFEAQLEMRDEYERAIYDLAERGKLGWSSGTAPHLVERKAAGAGKFEITRWPLALDATLTPTPMDWRNRAVPLKSLPINAIELDTEPEADTPEAVKAAATAGQVDVNIRVVVDQNDQPKTTMKEVKAMPEINQEEQAAPVTAPANDERIERLEATTKAVNDRIEKLLDVLEKEAPAAKGGVLVSRPGAPAQAARVKGLGDWLLGVRNDDAEYLADTYGTVKSISGDQGATGGYLVPEEYEPRLLTAAQQSSRIVEQVFSLPVNSPSGKLPVLDITRTPTAGAGDVAMAGGLTFASRAEGGSYTEAQAYFEEIRFNVNSESLEVQATIEMAADSPIAIESLLTRLFGTAMSAKVERHILRGTGAGQPLGILNAPALINISPDTDNAFVLADAAEMRSRLLMLDGAKPFWIAHSSMQPDIAALQVGSYGPTYIQNVQTGTLDAPLLGYPIVYSEHLPQANSSGCILLADLNAYVLFRRGGMSVFYSEHTRRTSGKVAWYVDYRIDGQPWVSGSVTDASPGGSYTKSPFVNFND